MSEGDTTQEIKVPLPEAIDRASLDLTILGERLRRIAGQMPAGQIQNVVGALAIRTLGGADLLEAQVQEIRAHWPTTEVDQ